MESVEATQDLAVTLIARSHAQSFLHLIKDLNDYWQSKSTNSS